MNTRRFLSAAAISITLAAAAQAQSMGPGPAPPAAASSTHLGVGLVRSVDTKSRMVTIAHQAIASMGMPAMTMPFRLDDAISISSLKAGDTVAFVLAATAQGLAIMSLEAVGPASGDKSASAMPDMPHMRGMAMMDQCREMMTRKQ